MERLPLSMEREDQYYKNGHTIQSDLQIQHTAQQNTNDLHRLRKSGKIHTETQKIQNS
jgi:hypothetical protein